MQSLLSILRNTFGFQDFRANQNVLFAFSEQVESPEGEEAPTVREPTSVSEAVRFATGDCPRLLFLDSSRSSAEVV